MSDLKSDPFDHDVAVIFAKLKDITDLTLKYSNNVFDSSYSSFEANLTKIQSFILKNLINLMPILISSKRYSMNKIRSVFFFNLFMIKFLISLTRMDIYSEFYIGFLNSRYVLQTHFLSKLIRTKLFEHQGKIAK